VANPVHRTCFVCNQQIELQVEAAGIWAGDRAGEGARKPLLVFAHRVCIERVAHADYDLDRPRGKPAE